MQSRVYLSEKPHRYSTVLTIAHAARFRPGPSPIAVFSSWGKQESCVSMGAPSRMILETIVDWPVAGGLAGGVARGAFAVWLLLRKRPSAGGARARTAALPGAVWTPGRRHVAGCYRSGSRGRAHPYHAYLQLPHRRRGLRMFARPYRHLRRG